MSGADQDLRSFLAESRQPVCRIESPISVVHEITALHHASEETGGYPVFMVDRPRLEDGSESPLPLVTNLFASRVIVARYFGIGDHRNAAREFSRLSARPVPPEFVHGSDAPVREIVFEGEAADLTRLPVLTQHQFDAAPYLTAAHIVTCDPETGIDNSSIQRCAIRGPRFMTSHIARVSHNGQNVKRWWARGEACPVAIWIGHHPAVMAGAQAKLGYPESHWGAAGGLAGRAVRLVPTITHGDLLHVPADAEIVIEGWIEKDRWEADGPLGEYHGYMGLQMPCATIAVERITMRRDAIYADCGAGLRDHLIPDNLAIEGKIYSVVRGVAPSLLNVHAPYSGRRFNIYLQFRQPRPGEVRDALAAALSLRRHRTFVALDDDVDIFDDRDVMWALATRVQWQRDLMRIDGLSKPAHDPSLPPGALTITKAGIDATLPVAPGLGLPRPVASRLSPRKEALEKAESLLEGADMSRWPTS